MTEDESRKSIVAEAKSWIGTPYHPNAKIKHVGVDCAMFPAAVYAAVGMTPDIHPVYAQDWMMHRDEELFLSYVTPYAREITRDLVGPGDFVIWKFGRTYSHSAIVINLPVAIHAVIRGSAVIEVDIDQDSDLNERPVRFFSLFGKN